MRLPGRLLGRHSAKWRARSGEGEFTAIHPDLQLLAGMGRGCPVHPELPIKGKPEVPARMLRDGQVDLDSWFATSRKRSRGREDGSGDGKGGKLLAPPRDQQRPLWVIRVAPLLSIQPPA